MTSHDDENNAYLIQGDDSDQVDEKFPSSQGQNKDDFEVIMIRILVNQKGWAH